MSSAPGYSLRTAAPDDLEALYSIHKAGMQGYVEETYGAWDETFQHNDFMTKYRLVKPPRSLDVIEIGEEIAGYLDVEMEADGLHLNNIRIAPRWQGVGLGTMIVESVLADGRVAGTPIWLQVLRVNPARRLYERLGFVTYEETGTHYRMRSGG